MKYVVIIIFALAVVLLGANELHQKYAPKGSKKKQVNKEVVEDMHGLVRLEERTGTGKGTYRYKELKKRSSEAVPSKKQSVLEKDNLESEDRGQLRDLISRVVP